MSDVVQNICAPVFGPVAAGDVNMNGMAPPPTGHPNSRDCPQCGRSTWRYTERCVTCWFDLAEHDIRVEQARVDARRWIEIKAWAGSVLITAVMMIFMYWLK